MTLNVKRLLAIVVVIVIFLLAWYTLIEDSISTTKAYNGYLEVAREKAKLEMYDDSFLNYQQALAMKDSLELRMELAQVYSDAGKINKYVETYNQIMTDFPYEAVGYEKIVEYNKEEENYKECYSVMNVAKKRKVQSEYLDKTYTELAYEYSLSGKGYETVGVFSGGYCAVKKSNGNWGYINKSGNAVLAYTYLNAAPFSNQELATVKTQENKFVVVNPSGSVKHVDVENKEIEEFGLLSEDLMPVKYGGKYHYCDVDFKEQFGSYDYAGAFNYGVAAVREGGFWYVVNTKGEKISEGYTDIKLDEKGVSFRSGVAFAKKNDKYIMIDTNGKQVGSLSWDDACVFASLDLPAAVKSGEKWGFVNASGEIVVEYTYENAKSFSNGLAAVADDGKWGYIGSEDYALKIEYTFEDAMYFTDVGTALVKENGGWAFLKLYRFM